MNDISDKITEILNNPSALENIRNMAESMFGNSGNSDEEKSESPADNFIPDVDISKIISVISKIQNSKTDERSRLILALKPHLTPKRQEKADRAVKILKLLDILPLLQESGFLNF